MTISWISGSNSASAFSFKPIINCCACGLFIKEQWTITSLSKELKIKILFEYQKNQKAYFESDVDFI